MAADANVGGVTSAAGSVGSSCLSAFCNIWASGLARCAGTSRTIRLVVLVLVVVAMLLLLLLAAGTFRRLRRCIADRGFVEGGVDFVQAARGAVSSEVSEVLAPASPPTGTGGADDDDGMETGGMCWPR